MTEEAKAMTAEEVGQLKKKLGDEAAKSRIERNGFKIKSAIWQAIAEAGALPAAAEILEPVARVDESGAVVLQHGEITVPLDAEVVVELLGPENIRARTGGGSGGRKPATAGPGKADDDVLRPFSQEEWNKMTPDQRVILQKKRMLAHGVMPR